eukprot:21009_5
MVLVFETSCWILLRTWSLCAANSLLPAPPPDGGGGRGKGVVIRAPRIRPLTKAVALHIPERHECLLFLLLFPLPYQSLPFLPPPVSTVGVYHLYLPSLPLV